MKRQAAFTLIELLIVVAIIAILAAIAVPNFLEAQVRAKISRTKNDMRTMATALESYAVDSNGYPPSHRFGIPGQANTASGPILERLSTPISYLANSLPQTPFQSKQRISINNARGMAQAAASGTGVDPIPNADLAQPAYRSYMYRAGNDGGEVSIGEGGGWYFFGGGSNPNGNSAKMWLMHSPGPQMIYFNLGGVLDNSSAGAATSNPGGNSSFGECLNLVYDSTNGTISVGGMWRNGGNVNARYAKRMNEAIQTAQ